MTCSTCRAWNVLPEAREAPSVATTYAECHAGPPTAGPTVVATFPLVAGSNWCLKHLPLPKPKKPTPEPPLTDLRP